MSELKTQKNDASVTDFLNSVSDQVQRQDAFVLLELYKKVTGLEPVMWGTSIVGFGSYHYKSERSRQEGDWLLIGFSTRKRSLTLYLMLGFDDVADLLSQLGKHKVSKSCLYINKLADVDMAVLEKLIAHGFDQMKQTYTIR